MRLLSLALTTLHLVIYISAKEEHGDEEAGKYVCDGSLEGDKVALKAGHISDTTGSSLLQGSSRQQKVAFDIPNKDNTHSEGEAEEMERLERQIAMLEHQAKTGAGGPEPEELQKLTNAIELIEKMLEGQFFNENKFDQDTLNNKSDRHKACARHKDRRLGGDGDVTAAYDSFNFTKTKKT